MKNNMSCYNLSNHLGVEEDIFINWMTMIGISSSLLQK